MRSLIVVGVAVVVVGSGTGAYALVHSSRGAQDGRTASGTASPQVVTPRVTPTLQTSVPQPSERSAAAGGKLTAAQLAGQRVIYSYLGHTPPASLLAKIRQGEAAGVIFFKGNYQSAAQMKATIKTLNAANAQSPVKAPLLLMTDQEGGVVRRLPGAPALSEKAIGQSKTPGKAATAAGTGAGKNLRGLGMNLNLSPVLDVYRTAGDFDDQFGRSYSKNPKTVGTLGADFIRAQQKARVAATTKHFPGLGTATAKQNTDERPVTLKASKKTLRTVDELPYVNAIKAGTKLVMLSWAVYPSLDAKHPAGLSSTIIQGELRKRLGFKGVTITDAMEAGALKAYGTPGNRSVLAAGAGMDLLLFTDGNVSHAASAVSALAKAESAGKLNAAAFQAAANRVTTLRKSL